MNMPVIHGTQINTLPEVIGKYIQDFLRPSTSTYLRYGRKLYKRLLATTLEIKHTQILCLEDQEYILIQMKYIMGNYEKILLMNKSISQRKWMAIRNSKYHSKDEKQRALNDMTKELGIVYGIDYLKYAPIMNL